MLWKNASNLIAVAAVAPMCLIGSRLGGHTVLTSENFKSANADPATHLARTTRERAQEEAIRETVFRYQFAHPFLPSQSQTTMYFLNVCGHYTMKPSDRLLHRLAQSGFRVKTGAQSISLPGRRLRGISLCQTAVRWIGSNEVELDSNGYQSPERLWCATYHLVHHDDEWFVADAITS